ncbi:putative DNA-directed RNA polymerase [Seiridium cardinale]|uniref:DNA-directed RNA polymerase n=1 Tax=Seiridium cardinale TaxID=138064 RepID=A0ABR2Y6U9_9PEZI
MPGRTKKTEVSEDTEMEDAPTSAQPGQEQTQETGDDAQDDPFEEDGRVEEEEEVIQRVRILPGSSATAASFEFLEEGHTLGNALRYIIMKNPDVEFCAYSIPHPSEAKMNIRIQTYGKSHFRYESKSEAGLKDMEDMCDIVEEKFWAARNDFVANQ